MNVSKEALEANERLIAKRKTLKLVRPNPDPGRACGPEVDVTDHAIEEGCNRMLQYAREAMEFRKKVALFIKVEAKLSTCHVHGCQIAPDLDLSVAASRAQGGALVLVFGQCPQCREVTHGPDDWLIRAGVPKILAGSRFEGWKVHNPKDQEAINAARQFCKQRAGFLVLLGTRGLGKSHLAVSSMAELHCGLFITQLALLKQMRRHDYDGEGIDIVEKAKRTRLLVLDELGLSVGGRDELPMLYEVLDYRHSNYLPTIITGNLTQVEFLQAIGERVADRLRQSLFRQVVLEGVSMRGQLRGLYGRE